MNTDLDHPKGNPFNLYGLSGPSHTGKSELEPKLQLVASV